MEKISLFNTRYDPAKRSESINDSSANAKLQSTLKVESNLAQISFKNRDIRIAEWPKGCGTNTLDFSVTDKNGNFYEVRNRIGSSNFLKFPELPEDYAAPPQQRINTPIMNKVLDNCHDFQFETINKRLSENKIKGGIISKVAKPIDPLPTTGSIGPGAYDVEKSLASLNRSPMNMKFSTIPRASELCQLCEPQERKPRGHRRFRGTGSTELSPTREASTSRSPSPVAHSASSPELGKSSIVRDIKFSKVDRWKHPMYKREKYVKTSGVKLSPDYDKCLNKRIIFSMTDASARGDGLAGVNSTTSGVDVDADCGNKMSLFKSVKLSPIKYTAAFRSKAEMGMTYPVPASGTEIGPGTFQPPPAIQIKFPGKPSFSTDARVINFAKILAPDPPGDTKPPSPIVGGRFLKAGQEAGRNVHLRNLAKKKFSTVYPEFARKKFGADCC